MKYWAEFPQDGSQYEGRHWFFTVKSRSDFLAKALRLGYSTFTVGRV